MFSVALKCIDIRWLDWGSNTQRIHLPVLFQVYDFTADDMQDLGEIGRGNYGTVNKMQHKKTSTVMAVKVNRVKDHLVYTSMCRPVYSTKY